MHPYHIVSYCSENYSDAFDFVIDSWLRTRAERIIVYTDTDKISHPDKRVLIIPFFTPSSDWIVSVERKIETVVDYINIMPKVPLFTFMDIDCYITSDISSIFDLDFDIAVTRLLEKTPHAANTASAAPWYGKWTPQLEQFIQDWTKLARLYKAEGKGTRPHKVSFVQYSFTTLLRRDYANKGPCKVHPADKRVWNCEGQDDNQWISTIQQFKPKVIHFKSRKFRNPDLVKRALAAFKRV